MNRYTKIAATSLLGTSLLPTGLRARHTPRQKEEKRPNIIFVFADQWRRQSLGYMGEDPVLTPNLDKFASCAFSFDPAVACRPVSGPNRACLMNGLLENTIVVFTADHGESMGSQGLMTKGTWFEESAGVPCIIGWRGKTISKRAKNVINSIDLLPSLLGLSEIPIPEDIDGVDYSPMLFGHEFNAPEYACLSFDFGGLAEWNAPRYRRGIYTDRYTYVLCGMYNSRDFTKNGIALYDRQKDPLQLNPIGKGEGYDRIIDE